MITVPLISYIDDLAYLPSSYASFNPYFTSYYTSDGKPAKDGDIYKTVIHNPNPIPSYISPLGTAVHNNDPVVFYHKYHQYSAPKKSDKNITLSISSPAMVVPPVMPLNESSINADPEVRRRMSAFFFEKMANHWLHSDYEDLLKYLVVKSKKVSLVSNKSQYEKNSTSSDVEMKIDFIVNNVMTKYDMKSFLKKLCIKTGINWYDLYQHKSFVKKAIYKKIKKNILKMIVH